MNTIAIILTAVLIVFLGHAIRSDMQRFRFYRKRRGGNWYKYRGTGELPGLIGTWWSQFRHEDHRYYELVAEEHWDDLLPPRNDDEARAQAWMKAHSYKETDRK